MKYIPLSKFLKKQSKSILPRQNPKDFLYLPDGRKVAFKQSIKVNQ